jgi:hypothetical protein
MTRGRIEWTRKVKERVREETPGGGRWLTEDAVGVARSVLEAWMRSWGETQKRRAPELLQHSARSLKEEITWEALFNRCDRARRSASGDSAGTIELAVTLLYVGAEGMPDEAASGEGRAMRSVQFRAELASRARELWSSSITTVQRPAGAVSSAPAPRPALSVHCPTSSQDHRVLLVGLLPERLYPIVLVEPGDDGGRWYTQEKPLIEDTGRAFAAYVYLGNPRFIGHPQAQTTIYRVSVHALRHKEEALEFYKTHARSALARDQLDELLRRWDHPLDWPGNPHEVTRLPPPVRRVRVGNEDWEDVPRVRQCTSPTLIEWNGSGPVDIEVRDVRERDRLVGKKCVDDESGQKRVVLMLESSARESPERAPAILLPKAGLYRVKLYPAVKSVLLDRLLELWIQIDV